MSGTASGLNVSWAPVTLTQTSPSVALITLTEITSVEFPRSAEMKEFRADAKKFASGVKAVNFKRGCKIESGNCGQWVNIPEGTICTIVATLQDQINGTGAGAITYTLINAVVSSNPVAGKNNEFASVTIEFVCFGGASDADPLSSVIAT